MNRVERNELVRQHLPLVGYLVSDLCLKAPYLSRDDLASAGAIALAASADAFRPDLGAPFGAFARRRILDAFAQGMRAGGWAASAARGTGDNTSVRESLAAALDRTATVEEMASTLGVRQSDVAPDPGFTQDALSHQRSEAVGLVRDALAAPHAHGSGQASDPKPAIMPRLGTDYLSQLAEATAGGITRAIFPSNPMLNEAV